MRAAIPLLAALGATVGTLYLQRAGDEGADEAVAEIDARRLAVDMTFPGTDCAFDAVVGWGGVGEAERWTGINPIPRAVTATRQMSTWGPVRLHFTLPRTADMTTIDVRDVSLETAVSALRRPSWSISPEGCGGGQYSQDYRITITRGVPELTRIDGLRTGAQLFEPFSVDPGENVHVNFEMNLCDRRTYDLRFVVSYKPDTGPARTVRLPHGGPLRMTGLPARTAFAASEGRLVTLPPEVVALQEDLPYACRPTA